MQWLAATVVDINEDKVKVNWNGYTQKFDSWIKIANVRMPVQKRILLKRDSIQKSNFPVCNSPEFLQHGDMIFDTARNESFIVEINDPFHKEVYFLSCLLYI